MHLLIEWLYQRPMKPGLPRSIQAYLFETRVRHSYLQFLQSVVRLALQHPCKRFVVYPAAFPREYICFFNDSCLSMIPSLTSDSDMEVNVYVDYPDPTVPEDLPALLYLCTEKDLLSLLLEWKRQSHRKACHILDRYLDVDHYSDPPMTLLSDPDMNLVCSMYDLNACRIVMEMAIPGTSFIAEQSTIQY